MGAWELLVAVLSGAIAARQVRRRRFIAFVGVGTVVLAGVDLARGHFPVGSFGVETLLTAVLVRVTTSEPIAGLASRLLLVAIVYAAFVTVAGLVRVGWRQLRLAMAFALILVSCREPDSAKTTFEPAKPGEPSERVQLFFDAPGRRPAEHPIVSAEARTNATCLACHAQILGATELPLVQKKIHEIHARIARVDHACIDCHESAGLPGFPGEHPGERARRESNQKCAGCHSQNGAPFWAHGKRASQ
jgi:hypothetical protein